MVADDKDPIAQSLAAKRWAKTTKAERSAVAKAMNEARWGKSDKPSKKKAKRKS